MDCRAECYLISFSQKHDDLLSMSATALDAACQQDELQEICHEAVLASLLNTSASSVRQWETGNKHPSGPSRKLLHLLDHKGLEVLL